MSTINPIIAGRLLHFGNHIDRIAGFEDGEGWSGHFDEVDFYEGVRSGRTGLGQPPFYQFFGPGYPNPYLDFSNADHVSIWLLWQPPIGIWTGNFNVSIMDSSYAATNLVYTLVSPDQGSWFKVTFPFTSQAYGLNLSEIFSIGFGADRSLQVHVNFDLFEMINRENSPDYISGRVPNHIHVGRMR